MVPMFYKTDTNRFTAFSYKIMILYFSAKCLGRPSQNGCNPTLIYNGFALKDNKKKVSMKQNYIKVTPPYQK